MKSLSNVHAMRAAPTCPAPGLEPGRLGGELKLMFSSLTAGPMPDRMVQLADALEDAFRRGELFEAGRSGSA